MKLEVTNKYTVALPNVTNVRSKIIVQKASLNLIFSVYFVVNKCSLRCIIVVVQCVNTFGFSEAILNILLCIKAVHKDKIWWLGFIKQLLLETVAILPVVDEHFSIAGRHKPLVVGL